MIRCIRPLTESCSDARRSQSRRRERKLVVDGPIAGSATQLANLTPIGVESDTLQR